MPNYLTRLCNTIILQLLADLDPLRGREALGAAHVLLANVLSDATG